MSTYKSNTVTPSFMYTYELHTTKTDTLRSTVLSVYLRISTSKIFIENRKYIFIKNYNKIKGEK